MKLRSIPLGFAFLTITLLQCVHLKEASTQFDQGQYTESIQLCKAAIAADSTDSQAYLLLSKNYVKVDSLTPATQAAESAFKYAPENNSVIRHLSHLYVTLGQQAAKEKNYRHAIEFLRNAKKIAPQDSATVQALADYYYDRGQLDRAKTEYKSLKSIVHNQKPVDDKLQTIENRTQKADAAVQKGIAAINRKHYKTAQTELKKALKNKPDNQEAKYQLHMAEGHALYKKGSKSAMWEAIEAFGLAMAIKDTLAEPHYWLAKAYERKDDREFTNAIDEYTKVLELDPNGPHAKEARTKLKKLKALKTKLDNFWGR